MRRGEPSGLHMARPPRSRHHTGTSRVIPSATCTGLAPTSVGDLRALRAGHTDEGNTHETDGADETNPAFRIDVSSPRPSGRPLSRRGYRSDRFYGFRGLLREELRLRAPTLGTTTPTL